MKRFIKLLLVVTMLLSLSSCDYILELLETTTKYEGEPFSEVVSFNNNLKKDGPLTNECLPSTGSPNVLVIPVNLDNTKATTYLLNQINIAFNGTEEETGWESVRSYYQESSYNKLYLKFDVLDEWFTPKNNKHYYNQYYDDEEYVDGSNLLLHEALEYYEDKLDLTKYDNDSDGFIDAVWLIYNCDVEFEDDDSLYWAFVSWDYKDTKYDGKKCRYYGFAGTDFMYEESELYNRIQIDAHTYIHETGHLLGLDDYYDYDDTIGPEGGLYAADMMDYNIGDHGMINKLLLGWVSPTIVKGVGEIEVEISSFSTTGEFILISNHEIKSIYDEYFLIEYYTGDGLNSHDKQIKPILGKDNGIRVIHVNAKKNKGLFGMVTYNDGDYQTGFKYDNSDADKLFCNMLVPYKPTNSLATHQQLYTTFTSDLGYSSNNNYKMHDGKSLPFKMDVISLGETATLKFELL